MVAQAPDGRTGRLAGAAGIALVLVGLTLLLEPASCRAGRRRSCWPSAWPSARSWRCAGHPQAACEPPWSA